MKTDKCRFLCLVLSALGVFASPGHAKSTMPVASSAKKGSSVQIIELSQGSTHTAMDGIKVEFISSGSESHQMGGADISTPAVGRDIFNLRMTQGKFTKEIKLSFSYGGMVTHESEEFGEGKAVYRISYVSHTYVSGVCSLKLRIEKTAELH